MSKVNLSDITKGQKAEEVSAILKFMAHPMRLKLLCALVEGERSVLELAEICDAHQVAISQALAKMKQDSIVECRREAQFMFYRISDPRITELVGAMSRIFCE
jgi:DNA-binding transcriptional ArsR family regulator